MMGTHQPIRKTVTPEIPDKLYFRIGDVARLCEVPAYVLRFWETEFPQLKPNKGGTGQRLYRKRDVEMTLRIKSLLYDQGYTIPGARQVFKNEAKAREAVTPFESPTAPVASAIPMVVPAESTAQPAVAFDKANVEGRLRALRKEMQELLAMLGSTMASAEPVVRSPKPLRPRLVTEARPAVTPKIALKPEPRLPVKPEPRLLDRRQGDLFSIE
jgi:DNA-binding transcriptional MerR regulator